MDTFWDNVSAALMSGAPIIEKTWGFEAHIVNHKDYCLKYLVFDKGASFSYHYHKIKKELWHCLMGKFKCLLTTEDGNDIFRYFHKGNILELPPHTIHQLYAIENSIIVEVSTTDFKEDSYRLPSRLNEILEELE